MVKSPARRAELTVACKIVAWPLLGGHESRAFIKVLQA